MDNFTQEQMQETIREFIRLSSPAFKADAKMNFDKNKELIQNMEMEIAHDYDKNNNEDNRNFINLAKAKCLMSAGVYNKNEDMFERGINKIIKFIYKIMECDFSNYTIRDIAEDGSAVEVKNDNAYLVFCNRSKVMKADLDELRADLNTSGYFS
jgi:hypothetical protein